MEIISAQAAIEKYVKSGATVAVEGFIGLMKPEELIIALRDRFLQTGKPRDLTIVHCAGQGDGTSPGCGINRLALEGLVSRIIASHFAMAPDKYSETNMGNLYLRPEFGLYFPTKYRKRTQEKLPITGSLTYGYNYGLFMTRTEMESYREKYGITSDADLPWTSVNHHMITFRINFNFANIREFQ